MHDAIALALAKYRKELATIDRQLNQLAKSQVALHGAITALETLANEQSQNNGATAELIAAGSPD